MMMTYQSCFIQLSSRLGLIYQLLKWFFDDGTWSNKWPQIVDDPNHACKEIHNLIKPCILWNLISDNYPLNAPRMKKLQLFNLCNLMLYSTSVDVIGLRCIMIKYVYRFKIYKFYSILTKKCLNFFWRGINCKSPKRGSNWWHTYWLLKFLLIALYSLG